MRKYERDRSDFLKSCLCSYWFLEKSYLLVHNECSSASKVFSLSIQVGGTTIGAVHSLPSLTPCGLAVPAGPAWEADPAPPHPPPPVLPLLLLPQGPSTATALGVLDMWSEEAFAFVVLAPPHPLSIATSIISIQMRRRLFSLPLLLLLTVFNFPSQSSVDVLPLVGTAELFPWSSPTCCRFKLDHKNHTSSCTTGKRASLGVWLLAAVVT